MDAIFGADKLGLRVEWEGDENEIRIHHPKISRCTRTMGIDGDGNRYIHNDYFQLKAEFQGGRFGTEVFAAEVEGAREAGFDYIVTHAAKVLGVFNGYYTWPSLGYDQTLDTLGDNEVAREAKRLVPGAKGVLDVMKAERIALTEDEKEKLRHRLRILASNAGNKKIKDSLNAKIAKTEYSGKDWWLAFGVGMEHAKFYLKPGSRSEAILTEVMAKKKEKKAEAS